MTMTTRDRTAARGGEGTDPMTTDREPIHVAVIMDGNGRWANARGKPRVAGHREGAKAVRKTVESAPELGIGTLTLYAFSSDNWNRPAKEVATLMRLLRNYLRRETARAVKEGIRVRIFGRRDRLDPDVVAAMDAAERATAAGTTLELRIAVDYSSRDVLLRAAALHRGDEPPTRDRFARLIAEASRGGDTSPDVDLLIRTGGERRLSDFLLWECSYAELFFSERMWPEFDGEELAAAVAWFHERDRRFGHAVDRVGDDEAVREVRRA
jgi:undecaprenyl diphosphate synthase